MEVAAGRWQVGKILHSGSWPKRGDLNRFPSFSFSAARAEKRKVTETFFPTTTKSQDVEAQTGRGTSQNRWNKNMFVNLTGL